MSGVVEGIGLVALLPLLSLAISPEAVNETSAHFLFIKKIFSYMSLEPTVGVLLFFISTIIIIKSIISFFSMLYVGYTSNRIIIDLRKKIVNSTLNANWSHLLDTKSGRLSAALGTESERAATGYLAFGKIVSSVVQMFSYLIVAYSVSKELTLFSVLAGGFFVWILKGFIRMSRKASEDESIHNQSFMSILIDGIKGLKPIKSMGMEGNLENILIKDMNGQRIAKNKQIFSSYFLNNLQEPIQTVTVCVGLYFAITYMNTKFESLLVLALVFYRAIQKISAIQLYSQSVANSQAPFHFVHSVIEDAESIREESTSGELIEEVKFINFKDVSFAYGERQILNKAELSFVKGQISLLHGESGAGKTTIIDLLTGLLKARSGQILINDLEISEIDLRSYRSRIGYVPQDLTLLHDSIFENVTLGSKGISRLDVENSLKKTEAWEFVESFPDGMDTIVGEHGGKLSGGQRQRLSIARALVRNPDILILDESTTALDPKTEEEILNTVAKISKEMIVVAISHQELINKIADSIYSIQNGEVKLLDKTR